jgi:hypothetical protein
MARKTRKGRLTLDCVACYDGPAMDSDSEPTEAEREALVAQFEDGGRRFAERAEKNPWTHGLRAVLAIGDQGLIDDFVRRFKADEARRYPKRK